VHVPGAVIAADTQGDRTHVDLRAPNQRHRLAARGATSRRTAPAAEVIAVARSSASSGTAGVVSGPSGPSRRITACTWIRPRAWNSATFVYETRARFRNADAVSPTCRARVRPRAMVKRRQSSGACHCHRTWPV
jgi:hypothetical protein